MGACVRVCVCVCACVCEQARERMRARGSEESIEYEADKRVCVMEIF